MDIKLIYKKLSFLDVWNDVVNSSSSELSDIKHNFITEQTFFRGKPQIRIMIFDDNGCYSSIYLTEKRFERISIVRDCEEWEPTMYDLMKQAPVDILCEYLQDKEVNFTANIK